MVEKVQVMAITNGYDNVVKLYVEEISELSKALIKLDRHKQGEHGECSPNLDVIDKIICEKVHEKKLIEHVCEEIADVEIMLEQLKYLLQGESLVEAIKKYKIRRFFEHESNV